MALDLETLAVGLVVDTDEFQKGLGDADKVAQGWANKLGGAGNLAFAGLAAGATAAVAGVAVIGSAALDVSSQVDSAAANMAASLGIPIVEAERFAEIARNVYGNNFAESVTDAADVVTIAAQRMGGASEAAIESAATNALRLRDVFGTDVNESLSAAQTLMETFGVTSDEAFNMIAAGFQKGLDRSGDLLDSINEYAPQYANAEVPMEGFFNLMESGAAGGVLGVDKANDAFKEFVVRIQDGSDTTRNSLESLGINADELFANLADGTTTVGDAFTSVTGKLADTEDQAVQMQAGVGLLGTQFEDLGADAATALSLTGDSFTNVEGTIESLDAKYATFGSAVEGIWRRLVVSISPFTDKLLDLVNDAMPKVMDAFDAFDAAVGPTMEGIGSTIETVVNFINGIWERFSSSVDTNAVGPLRYWQEWADANLPRLQQLFQTILGAIQTFWDNHGATIMHIVDNTFNTVWTVIDTVMRTIGDLITLALQVLTGDWEGAWGTMQGIVGRIWEAIQTVIGNQLDSLRTAITSIDWAELGRNIMQGVADGISNGAQNIVNAAEDAAQRALEAAKSWLGIGSPSKVAADDIGEPFAQGVGIGAMRGLRDLAGKIDTGLAAVMGDLAMPQPVMAGAGGRAPITINITLQGSATYEDGRKVGKGVLDELRSRGLA